VLGRVPAPVIDEDVEAGYWRARAEWAEALVPERAVAPELRELERE